MMRYISGNKCSDEVLQRGIEAFAEKYYHDLAVLGVGLAFTLASLLSTVALSYFCTPLREKYQEWKEMRELRALTKGAPKKLVANRVLVPIHAKPHIIPEP